MNYYEEFETSYQTLTYKHWINQFKMGVPRKIFWMRHCHRIVEHTCTCAQIIFNIDLHGESERERKW